MIRVIIADDEERICKLIIKLVDWDKIGMEVVGTAQNGVQTLELIEKEHPEIVITDIRMPGYDGLTMIEKAKKINSDLEFIIISGYGEFEYAKRAIDFGVKDYLLKPINKEELFKSLTRIGEYVKNKKEQLSLEKEYEYFIKNDANKIREAFLNKFMLFNLENYKEYTLEEINQNYHFNFKEGFFSVAVLKIDYVNKKVLNNLNNVIDIIKEIIQPRLQEITCESHIINDKNNLYIVMNYEKNDKKQIKSLYLKLIEYLKQRIFIDEKIEITIALGEEVKNFQNIAESLKSARFLIEDRILKGTGKIIEIDEIKTDKIEIEEVFYDFSKKFIKAVELLNMDDIKKTVLNFKKDITSKNIRGAELKGLVSEIGNIYNITLKKNNIKTDYLGKNFQKLKTSIEECSSIDTLFDQLLQYIDFTLSIAYEKKSHNNLKQIRQAKKYIEENYMNNITLEDLGKYIGFNPSYFSSFFKKETGISFIEYLSNVRIEKAKELLKESDLRIQDICFMVGYNDVKHFTKSFVKYTGLKPNEYRKIFT